jgi:NAD(P)H-hydrate epimerase
MLKDKENKKVAVFCGKGNNGGDGLVAARYLLNKKVKVNVYLLAKDTELKNDPLINLKILKKIIPPISIKNISDLESFNRIKERLKETSIIIDAIFGTGLTILVREPYNSIIRYLNKLNIPIVSVDIPSGLDATDGRILGAAIKADKTVTFCLPKKGLLKNEGPRQTGELITCDIGIPLLAIKKVVKQYEDK